MRTKPRIMKYAPPCRRSIEGAEYQQWTNGVERCKIVVLGAYAYALVFMGDFEARVQRVKTAAMEVAQQGSEGCDPSPSQHAAGLARLRLGSG